MKPVEVYCCGEVIACNGSINECETCGSKYDIEGDRIYEQELREIVDGEDPAHIIKITIVE
jgi:hypothetical protein